MAGTRRSWWTGLAVGLVGLFVGTMLLTPVGAHFTQNTKHLAKHAWQQFIKDKANQRFYPRPQADRRFVGRSDILYARVDVDAGTGVELVDGNGATGAFGSGGTYWVRFDRPVVDCVKHVTAQVVRPPEPAASLEPSMFFVYMMAFDSGEPDAFHVYVQRMTHNGSVADFYGEGNGFALTVIC